MAFVAGKVAIVTGGASGIGLAIVEKLLENGAKGVVIADISKEKGVQTLSRLQRIYGDRVEFFRTDVTKAKELEDAFDKTIDKYNNLDIVVNNAGVADESQWEKIIAINLESVVRGTYLALKKYLPKYKTEDEAVIVNTASILGVNSISSLPTYTATKHGVIGLAKSLAEADSCKNNKIRVLTFCPGVVSTNLIDDFKKRQQELIIKELSHLSKLSATTSYIGSSVLKIINEARHGSVWIMEDETTPYEIVFPNRRELRKIC